MCLVASYSRGAYNSLLLKMTNSFYSKTCVKWPLSKDQKLVFMTNSAILSTFIKLSFFIKIFVLSIFEWSFYTGFTEVNNYLDKPMRRWFLSFA